MLRSGIGSARLDALEADPLSDRKDLAAAGRQLLNDPDPLRRIRGAEAIARYARRGTRRPHRSSG